MDDPDGKARLTGSCGDTMEIRLRFKNGRVTRADYWTNGCVHSLNCIGSAAGLAKGKDPLGICEIDAVRIEQDMGGLAADWKHCALLAEETLQAALEDHMSKNRRGRLRTARTHTGKRIRRPGHRAQRGG
jgi:nitrogen fixation NifU-like protein